MKSGRAALLIFLAFGVLGTPLAAEGQPARVARIGLLLTLADAEPRIRADAFRSGLRDVGYVEGEHFIMEYRYGAGRDDRDAELVADLVRLKVDVIVTGSTVAVRAAKKLTKTTPVVMAGTGDPVGTGLVTSLSRPGENVTGLSSLGPELNSKRLALLKEAVPGALRVAVLFNGANPSNLASLRELEGAAPALGLQLQPLDVRGPDDVESAFAAARRQPANALLVQRDPLVGAHRTRIMALAAKNRLPAMYSGAEFVAAGGLLAYGVNTADLYRRAAIYVDKILKGAKPGDLPIEQPTKFELVINMKTAKVLGLTIPPSLLLRADHVIE